MAHKDLDFVDVKNHFTEQEFVSANSYRENALWNEMREGNKAAFDILYEANVQVLYRYGMKITADSGIVEDAIQELFIDVWNKREVINEARSVKAYLLKSLKRRIVRQISQKKRKLFSNYDFKDFETDVEFSLEHTIIIHEQNTLQSQNLEKAIKSLSKRQREIIYLRFFSDMSFEEIADVMSLNISSTYKLVYKALDTLRKNLDHFSTLILMLSLAGLS